MTVPFGQTDRLINIDRQKETHTKTHTHTHTHADARSHKSSFCDIGHRMYTHHTDTDIVNNNIIQLYKHIFVLSYQALI